MTHEGGVEERGDADVVRMYVHTHVPQQDCPGLAAGLMRAYDRRI